MKRNTLTDGPKRQFHGSCLYIHADVWASEAEIRAELMVSVCIVVHAHRLQRLRQCFLFHSVEFAWLMYCC